MPGPGAGGRETSVTAVVVWARHCKPMTTSEDITATPLPEFDPERIVELDVREMLRAGGEPRVAILAAADGLPEGHILHLRTTFPPVPLLYLMHRRGFHHHTADFGESDWSTWFWRTAPPPAVARVGNGSGIDREGAEDMRLLPPPEPLLRILARLGTESSAFDVLLPFFPEPLVPLRVDEWWSMTLVEEASDGVRVRLSPAPK